MSVYRIIHVRNRRNETGVVLKRSEISVRWGCRGTAILPYEFMLVDPITEYGEAKSDDETRVRIS